VRAGASIEVGAFRERLSEAGEIDALLAQPFADRVARYWM
jgi:hypothetical protein